MYSFYTCMLKLLRQTYFDFPIHVLKNPSLIKYKFWFLVKMLRHKNSSNCLIFELKFLSHVYISMQNEKTIFGYFTRFMGFIRNIFNPVFCPRNWLSGFGGRPGRSTVSQGRSTSRSTDVHRSVHVWPGNGPVDRAVDRTRELCSLYLGGRPGCSNGQKFDRWRSTGRSTASLSG